MEHISNVFGMFIIDAVYYLASEWPKLQAPKLHRKRKEKEHP